MFLASGPLSGLWYTYRFVGKPGKRPKALDEELGWAPGHLKFWNSTELRLRLEKTWKRRGAEPTALRKMRFRPYHPDNKRTIATCDL